MSAEKPDMIYLEDRSDFIRSIERLFVRKGIQTEVIKTDDSLSVEEIQNRIRAAQAPFILADFQGVGMTARDILEPLIKEGFIPKVSIAALYTGGIAKRDDISWARTQIESGALAFGLNKPWEDCVPDLLKRLLKGAPDEQAAALAELKKQPFNP